jgi:hypothetical protein
MVVSGCVAPALDSGAYEHNALAALESAVSTTRVAALALDGRVDDRLTLAYADTVVTEAEDAIDPVSASFGVVDPPGRDLDTLRTEVLDLLGDAGDLLAEARLAVRREDTQSMSEVAGELRRLADDMERATASLS